MKKGILKYSSIGIAMALCVFISDAISSPKPPPGINPITVTYQGGTTNFITQETWTANYLVQVGRVQYPPPSQTMHAYNLPAFATQITSGSSACTATTHICPSQIPLVTGETCCLMLSLFDSSLQAGATFTLQPRLATTPATYHGQAALQTITVSALTETTLSVTPSTLALSVTGLTTTTGNDSGTPRVFTVTNTGSVAAQGVTCPTSSSPSITSIACVGCGTIQPTQSCSVTITPSATPSAAIADTNPSPVTLTIAGTNTNTLNPTVNVLTYGSFYEAGYLFSIIETVNTSQSIGGTVAAQTDAAGQNSTEYSPGGEDTTTSMYSGTDGQSNTSAMAAQYGTNQNYSAGYCIPPNYSSGGYTDWYLPAICQLGFGGSDDNFNCGSSPGAIPNIQYNLLVTNSSDSFGFTNNGDYWSSTASEFLAPIFAWGLQVAVGGGGGDQNGVPVLITFGVRCVRALTS